MRPDPLLLASLGHRVGPPERLARGMSSTAWKVVVDGDDLVVRVPNGDGLRPTPRYEAEAQLTRALVEAGAPVAPIEVRTTGDAVVSVAPHVDADPVRPHEWTTRFATDVAAALHALHQLPPHLATVDDVVQRFHLARIWPLDGTSLAEHPVAARWPERLEVIERMAAAIRAEASEPPRVVHTDLHGDHLLRSRDGGLAALLDFGDALAAPPSWDFACLRYCHGPDALAAVADHYPGGSELLERSRTIGVAFALYKLDKTPDRPGVVERVDAMLPPQAPSFRGD